MNRLILIGNGFDLAHGLDTRYSDFLKWYLAQAMKTAGQRHSYDDLLINVSKANLADLIYFNGKTQSEEALIEYLYHCESGLRPLTNNEKFKIHGQYFSTTFTVNIKSTLLRNLLRDCSSERWVDIENEFYELLKAALNQKDTKDKQRILKDLNDSLEALIVHLARYLTQLPKPQANPAYGNLLTDVICRQEIVLPHQLKEDEFPRQTYLLNFNYTNTCQHYLNPDPALIHPNSIRLNHIHGEINKVENPVIFGFGDELDEDYHQLELDKSKGFFKFIKSLWYFKTSNYHDLVRFIEADEFQVFVWGHSCGLSDRTMLNMIFEHDHCKSIKLFYYQDQQGNTNFTELTEEIARHFKNKVSMRKKIVPFDRSSPMPQQVDTGQPVN